MKLVCCKCNRLVSDHGKWTATDIEASKAATYRAPVLVRGRQILCPISPACIGRWIAHDPMPWEVPDDHVLSTHQAD